jgi:hypothetical protein
MQKKRGKYHQPLSLSNVVLQRRDMPPLVHGWDQKPAENLNARRRAKRKRKAAPPGWAPKAIEKKRNIAHPKKIRPSAIALAIALDVCGDLSLLRFRGVQSTGPLLRLYHATDMCHKVASTAKRQKVYLVPAMLCDACDSVDVYRPVRQCCPTSMDALVSTQGASYLGSSPSRHPGE